MRVIHFILGIVLAMSFKATAQRGIPPAFEITSDTIKYFYFPNKNWQYLTGKDELTFEEVSGAGHKTGFKDGDSLASNAGSYWLRYRLKNALDTPVNITIPLYREGHVYIAENGRWTHFTSGFLVPWSQKSGLKKIDQVEYNLPANSEVTVYQHTKQHNGSIVYPIIGIRDKVVAANYIDDEVINSSLNVVFLGGFLFFAGLFNLLFYNTVREKVYLFYALTLLITSIGNCYEMLLQALLREVPIAFYAIALFAFPLGQVFLYITLAMFLQADRYFPRFYKLYIALSILAGIVVFITFLAGYYALSYDQWLLSSTIISSLPMLAIITVTGIQLYKRRTASYVFALAVLPFTILMLLNHTVPGIPSWLYPVQRLSVMWGILVISWSLFQRYRTIMNQNMQQVLENERLAREKEEERNALIAQQNELLEKQVAERTAELSHSLDELKQTQNQLIQSEKMASLGELTAGIAHEIQNPLNFVNNFSEVSVELLEELEDEAKAGNIDDVLTISSDLKQNLEKINHHGKRADGIVKGMLQHSRASSGQKEPTDVNALADEYLRLAYHGLRAKDKSFNAELVMHFDGNLPKVNAIPQDLGRVLLNLFTNAFYATQQKSRQSQSQYSDGAYKPTVEVTTMQVGGNSVEIVVKDNGTGIPDSIKDKILQPFFTTKPTGEGTGLGLSLSYDIVVKGHDGSITIDSKEGEGSEFRIVLPLGNS